MREGELELLRDVVRKKRVQWVTISPNEAVSGAMEETVRPFFEMTFSSQFSLRDILGNQLPGAIYRFRDFLDLSYLSFTPFPEKKDVCVLIGPFTWEPLAQEKFLSTCEKRGLVPKNRRVVDEFFLSVPVISENSDLFLMLEAFCERQYSGKVEVVNIENVPEIKENAMPPSLGHLALDDTFLDMKNMEKRYELENQILDAVTMGSEHKVNQIFSLFSEKAFEKRISDPLRNSKNYGIIMNTLLRKAAERGGVHPMYLDRISSEYALKIEKLSHSEEIESLMHEMFCQYCKLVRKSRSGSWLPIVQKTVAAIEADLSAELTLSVLAEKLSVTPGYLSSIFKKETGKTVTGFIRERRMKLAATLLQTTPLQIQTVALHCGMVDVQYFSKVFKKFTGKTPSQFRLEKRGDR